MHTLKETSLQILTSEQRNSLILERRTFLPSADREYGVSPAPLNWSSHLSPFLFTISPKYLEENQQYNLMITPRTVSLNQEYRQ